MPLPIVHSAFGYSLFRAGNKQKSCLQKTMLFILLANLADLDLLPGILVGKPLLFHKTFGHTFAAAVLCSFAAALLIKVWTKRDFIKIFLLSFTVYSSHLILDFLSSSNPPLLWPLQPIDFEKRFFIFDMLPLRLTGLKVFTVGLFSNLQHTPYFRKELFCLFSVLLVFLSRFIFRHLSASAKRQTTFIRPTTTYADHSRAVGCQARFDDEVCLQWQDFSADQSQSEEVGFGSSASPR